MRLKKDKVTKNRKIEARVSEDQYNQIHRSSLLYCEGNVSEFIAYAALNFVPNKEDLEEEKTPPKRRGRKKNC